jgi:hypothetical protein
MMDDFDPKAAALLILKKGKKPAAEAEDDEGEGESLELASALKALHKAMNAGDFDRAADIFKAALSACEADPYE